MSRPKTVIEKGVILKPTEIQHRVLEKMVTWSNRVTKWTLDLEIESISKDKKFLDHIDMENILNEEISKAKRKYLGEYTFDDLNICKYSLKKAIAAGIRYCNSFIMDIDNITDQELEKMVAGKDTMEIPMCAEIDYNKCNIFGTTLFIDGFRKGMNQYDRRISCQKDPYSGITINTNEYHNYTGVQYRFQPMYAVHRIYLNEDNEFILHTFYRNHCDEYGYNTRNPIGISIDIKGKKICLSNGHILKMPTNSFTRPSSMSKDEYEHCFISDKDIRTYRLIVRPLMNPEKREVITKQIKDLCMNVIYYNPSEIIVEYSSEMSAYDYEDLPPVIRKKLKNYISVLMRLYKLRKLVDATFIMVDDLYEYKNRCCMCGAELTPSYIMRRACRNCGTRIDIGVNAAKNLVRVPADRIFDGEFVPVSPSEY